MGKEEVLCYMKHTLLQLDMRSPSPQNFQDLSQSWRKALRKHSAAHFLENDRGRLYEVVCEYVL